jgi:hypothetical protein
MKKIQLAIMAVALVIAVQARASLYDITYTDGVNIGHGVIDVAGGSATSGSFTVTAGVEIGTTWTLSPGAGSGGGFQWDNLVFPASDPFLTSNGLLFKIGSDELNLWGNGPGNYSLWASNGGGYTLSSDGGVATITAVPEASTVIAGALLLLPFGASTLRILRRNRTA